MKEYNNRWNKKVVNPGFTVERKEFYLFSISPEEGQDFDKWSHRGKLYSILDFDDIEDLLDKGVNLKEGFLIKDDVAFLYYPQKGQCEKLGTWVSDANGDFISPYMAKYKVVKNQ